MEDTLTLARLTMMLLRASLPHPNGLPEKHGVVILPVTKVYTIDQALIRLAEMQVPLEVSADIRDTNLVISANEPTPDETKRQQVTAEMFIEGIRRLNTLDDPQKMIRAVGYRESILVPVTEVERWLTLVGCSDCQLGLGVPGPNDGPTVIGVLYLGPGATATLERVP